MGNPGPLRSSGSMTWVRYSLIRTTLPRPKATLTQSLPAMFATPASTAARSAMVAISTSAKSCAITCCSTHVAEPERSEWSASTTGHAPRATASLAVGHSLDRHADIRHVGEGEAEEDVHIEVGLARFPDQGALDQVHPRGSASPLQHRRGQDRHLHRRGGGGVVTADGADQHASRALALQAAVVMREVFGAEREVGLAQELGVLVAVRIEGAGDEGVAAHDLAHAAGDVGLGPSHAAHAHRAVEGEIDAVPCPAVLELGEHAAEKVLVCLRRDPA